MDSVDKKPKKKKAACTLLLSASPHHIQRDRSTLHRLGIENTVAQQEIGGALRFLQKNRVSLIICDESIGDSHGLHLVRALQKNTRLSKIPLVFSSTNVNPQAVLQAIASGAGGYLVRPYSMDNFKKQLRRAIEGKVTGDMRQKARKQTQPVQPAQMEEQDPSAPRQISRTARLQSYCRKGRKCLIEKEWNQAIVEFRKAIAIDDMFLPACEGLIEAWMNKENRAQTEKYICRTADIYRLNGEFEKAAKILKERRYIGKDEEALVESGCELVKNGDWEDAGEAFHRAEEKAPNPRSVHAKMARACQFTRRPEASAIQLAKALAKASGGRSAKECFHLIWGPSPRRARPRQRNKKAPSHNLSTGISDAWKVFCYTVQAFRQEAQSA